MRVSKIAEAIQLREAGHFDASRALLVDLVSQFPDDPEINCQMAWTHDTMGLEVEAVPFYERAISGGLSDEDLRGALLGLGSTYRVIGQDADAVHTLAAGVKRFPKDSAMRTFYTSGDPCVARYRRALTEYMEHPDELWLDGAWHARP